MAGFRYFISGETRPLDRARVEALGLGYAFTGGIENRSLGPVSPNGLPGTVFADDTRQGDKAAGYYPDEQTWRKLPRREGRPELWVGYWNDAKPTPADLIRPRTIRGGVDIILADGNAWKIPVVRRFDEVEQKWRSALTTYVDIDEDGKPIKGDPLEEYAHLWDITAPLAEGMFNGEATATTDEQVYAAVIALIQANYVVDLPELVAIRALANDDTLGLVVMAATRYEQLAEWLGALQKKTNQAESTGLTTDDSSEV